MNKDRIIKDIRNFFEQDLWTRLFEDHFKPVRVHNFWNNICLAYEDGDDDRTKTLPFVEYLHETKPYVKNIINNLKKFDTWKMNLTVVINKKS